MHPITKRADRLPVSRFHSGPPPVGDGQGASGALRGLLETLRSRAFRLSLCRVHIVDAGSSVTEIVTRRALERLGCVVMLPEGDAVFVFAGFGDGTNIPSNDRSIANYVLFLVLDELRRLAKIFSGLKADLHIVHCWSEEIGNFRDPLDLFDSQADSHIRVRIDPGREAIEWLAIPQRPDSQGPRLPDGTRSTRRAGDPASRHGTRSPRPGPSGHRHGAFPTHRVREAWAPPSD